MSKFRIAVMAIGALVAGAMGTACSRSSSGQAQSPAAELDKGGDSSSGAIARSDQSGAGSGKAGNQDEEIPKDLVKLAVVADATRLVPGQTFTVAARFDIAPEWHIYWENPGESGLSTEIAMATPDGFEAGKVRYPGPKSFVSSGGIVTYGYSKQVALSSQVRVPQNLTDDSYTFSVKANWLACKVACKRGRGQAEITVPVATADEPAAPDNQALFAAHTAHLPQPLTALSGVSHTWKTAKQPHLALSVPGTSELTFFPAEDNQIPLAEQVAMASGQETTLNVLYRADKPPPRARGVLGVGKGGDTAYYTIDLPLP